MKLSKKLWAKYKRVNKAPLYNRTYLLIEIGYQYQRACFNEYVNKKAPVGLRLGY